MAVNTASVSTAIGQETFTTGSVTARDGVAIGYRQIGRGPGLAVLHGAMESAHSHIQLAEALAGDFTVTLADRRGRGLSGPFAADYSLQNEVDDMEALLAKTGARYVFGVSSGAIIWLRAALALPAIQKIAIYEPPLFMDKSTPSAILTRYDAEVA